LAGGIITLGYIEELDDEERLIRKGYWNYGVMDKECDEMGKMYDSYKGL